MTNLDENFINSYINRTGFWYAFKRSVNDIGNLFILFRYLQAYEGLNWHNQQKEFSNILIKEKLLIPSKDKEDSSANSRGIKKVLELLGLCFVDKNEKLQITQNGKKFLNSSTNEELYDIKTNQLLKYQINNPLIKSNNFKEMQIKPFVFLLKLLSELDNQSINSLEYKLFVSRAHHMNGLEDVIDQIKLWRSLNENEKENIKNKIINSEIYHKISGYAAYSMVFFGKSSFTEIADHDDEKIIFLKNNKIEKINKILEDQNIFNYNYNLSTLDKFMSFYGCLQNKHEIIPVPEENLNLKNILQKTFDHKDKLQFGKIKEIQTGQIFKNRDALSKVRIHGPTMAGIWGRETEGACSIVLSGGYEDDVDDLDYILYTGHGGQDKPGGMQIKDQEFVKGNKALTISHKYQLPVRVTRGYQTINGPKSGYRYDGLYYVNKFERVKGKNGFYVCRFYLSRNPGKKSNINYKINKPIYFNKKNEINEKSSDDLQIALLIKGIKEDLTNDKSLSKEDKEKKICNRKIEDFFFFTGRTLNALKNEKIIYIKDLLIWDKNNLKQMQGMGLSSINEISEQLDEINKKYDVNLKFSDSKNYSILSTNNSNNNLFKKIDEIDFSVRTMNCLKNEDIIFIGDLVTKTESYMLHAPNFGRKSLQEIKNVLDSMSLYLGMEITWPPKDNDYPSKEISYDKSTKFIDLNDDNKINFFRSIEIVFENVRIISVCKNLEIENLGDLHQKIDDLIKIPNIGAKSIDEIKIELIKYISLPIGVVVNDWKETKKIKFEKFSKKLSSKIEKENSKDFENLQYLDEEIKLLMDKINFKRQDIIDYHYGLDGTGIKTLQESGDYFNVSRERIRQITSKYLRIISKKNITGLIILKKIEELLIELCPTSCVNFEKYLLDNKITNKRYMTRTLLSLFNLFLKKKKFDLLEKNSVIDYKNDPKYSKLIKFVYDNLNNYGCIKISFLSKKFNLNNKQVIDLLNLQSDISFIDEDWLYDNDKTRNRLYNILQKIFNVSSEVNKFQLLQAIKRVRRFSNPPSFEAISKYCQKELSATIDDHKILIPKNQIHKFFYNSRREILSDKELKIIKVFKNSDSKILTFNKLVNKLLDQQINTSTAHIYTSGNTPVIIKVRPGCYALVGTKFYPGEPDEFYKKNKDKGVKVITDYDHNDDGKIWIGYEINERTRGGKNFSINNSIYEILKGKYDVKGMNHKLNVSNKIIGRIGNKMFKDMLNLGDEIIFTFDLNKKNVEIEVGQKVMQNKYN